MDIERLHVFQIVESLQQIQTGFSLEYQNIHTRHLFHINTLSPRHTTFLQTNGVHPLLSDGLCSNFKKC